MHRILADPERRSEFAVTRGAEAEFVEQHFWARGYFVFTVGGMRKLFRSTSGIGSGKTSAWTKIKPVVLKATLQAAQPVAAALATPTGCFERLTSSPALPRDI